MTSKIPIQAKVRWYFKVFNFNRNFSFKATFEVIIRPKVTTKVNTINDKIPVILVKYPKIYDIVVDDNIFLSGMKS